MIWSVLLLKRYKRIPSLFRDDNGFPKDNRLIRIRERIYFVIRYSEMQVQTVYRDGVSETSLYLQSVSLRPVP